MFGIFKRLEDLESKLDQRTFAGMGARVHELRREQHLLREGMTYQQQPTVGGFMFINKKEVALKDVVKALVDHLELNVTTKSATPEKVGVTRKPSAAYVQSVLTGEDDA
jgi:hypothetical protein